MVILGLNISGFHSSACIIKNGETKSAITEERITRVKQDKSFPHKAINYCCEVADISKDEITDIYVGWNPSHYMYKSDNTLNDALKDRGKIAYLTLNELSVANEDEVLVGEDEDEVVVGEDEGGVGVVGDEDEVGGGWW